MNPIDGIIKKLREQKSLLASRFGIKEIGVFGSYLRGEQTAVSDLDILVEFAEAPSLFKFIEIENYLSQATGIRVDLVMKDSLKRNIGKQILSEVQYL
ncbi:MAG: nucleotidyltransferase family protein [Bacteroidia bacterium]|nr:nucleotidyltransferase family protein [Bacteroidia bacterium]